MEEGGVEERGGPRGDAGGVGLGIDAGQKLREGITVQVQDPEGRNAAVGPVTPLPYSPGPHCTQHAGPPPLRLFPSRLLFSSLKSTW